MKTVDLIVPCYNESEVLPLFYKKVTEVIKKCSDYKFSLIFVDDGSKDTTLDILRDFAQKDSAVKYISFSRNFGKESAMFAGLRFSTADYVGLLDADLQHEPELIIDMIKALEEGYDVAAARRCDRMGEDKIKSSFSNAFYKVINRISEVKIENGAQDFRIMKRKVVDTLLSMPEYNRFSKGLFSWVGFNTKWFEHENKERVAGQTKWSFAKLLRYAIDGIINFSTAPLRISLYIGSFTSIVGVIYAIYIIIKTLVMGSDTPGFPSIMCALLIFGGLILLSLGIIGEYLARLYLEVKSRPIFVINETNIEVKNNGKQS
ncbi:MAG: glycosyltransferase family 2 protein [Clostridiales bacterium]|nr:glycosyltransferase family 2 protein [Clostridiales bacterium]